MTATQGTVPASTSETRVVRLTVSTALCVTIELNDPTRFNAQSKPLLSDLKNAVRGLFELQLYAAIAAMAFSGVGVHFCTGGDLNSRNDASQGQPESSLQDLTASLWDQSQIVREMRELRMIKCGAVFGKLIGGGVAFALVTDWRCCSRSATFNYGNLPRGVNPLFMFSKALPRLVGQSVGF